MSTLHTETTLQKLTVPKLKVRLSPPSFPLARPVTYSPHPPQKELLARSSLPQTGKKDDLISRLLANPSSLSTTDEAPAPAAETAAPSPLVPVATPSTVPVPADAPAPVVEEATPTPVVVELSTEEKLALALAEEEKRKKRSERFGLPVPDAPAEGGVDVLLKRAEKFGGDKEAKEMVLEKVEKVSGLFVFFCFARVVRWARRGRIWDLGSNARVCMAHTQ